MTKMSLRIFHCSILVSVTKLPSWNVSVVPGIVSAEVTWADFPGNASSVELFLTYTHANENVTVLLPVESVDDRSYNMDHLLMPNSEYTFEVYAFTGDIEDDIYSSASVTVTTKEGGKSSLSIESNLRNWRCNQGMAILRRHLLAQTSIQNQASYCLANL